MSPMQIERPGIDYRILNFLLACVGGALAVWIAVTMPTCGDVAPHVTVSARPEQPVTVCVRGAVTRPGIYRLPPQTRLYEVLQQAGGALPDADISGLNTARRVHDEELILVPTHTAAPPPGAAPGLVDLNTAPVEVLSQVPGMSRSIAERIVAWRIRYGAFRSVDELSQIPGLKRRMKRLQGYVKV